MLLTFEYFVNTDLHKLLIYKNMFNGCVDE